MSFSGTKGYVTKPNSGAQINLAHPLSNGLVGCWLFNEGAGSRALDTSTKRNHGTFVNIGSGAWVGSVHGRGLLVNDVDLSRVNISSTSLTDFSIVSVCTPHDLSTINMVAGQNDGTLLLYTRDVLRAWYSGSDHLANTNLSIGTTYTVGFTSKGGVGTFYLDGKQDGTCSSVPSISLDVLLNNTWDNGFTGVMDCIFVYDKALSDFEMEKLHNDPFCNLLRIPLRRYYVPAAGPTGAIMNQFQNFNIGADLYNGGLIA